MLNFVVAMFWHLWKIATFRPGYRYLSDTKEMVWAFALFFTVASAIRWLVVNPAPLDTALLVNYWVNQVFSLAVAWMFLVKKGTNRSLFAVILGASAVIDFIVVGLYFADVLPSVSLPGWRDLAMHLTYFAPMIFIFNRQSEAIKASGYSYFREKNTLQVTDV